MNALQHEIQELVAEAVRMMSLVRQSVGLAQRALVDAEAGAADLCKDTDRQVDNLQDHLERRILIVIARRQPAAGDLRLLGAVYRALADIERAGDYAVHVARAGAELASRPPLKKYTDMQRILETTERMIERTVDALVEGDEDVAAEARAMDEEIDRLYEQIQRELITYMVEDPGTIGVAIKLLAVARYLERLADHIENVCEHIIFWRTGERI